ncbi:MAG: hypothetical protein LBL48_12085 [Azoarcus sp.]|jgi:hypothetical protein|nr:hypothetical protein [Azoarcus sp.]
MKIAFIPRIAFAALLWISGAAQAAGINCEKPEEPFFAALCEDAELLALFEAYQTQQTVTKNAGDRLPPIIRNYALDYDEWLEPFRWRRAALTPNERGTLKALYRNRIAELKLLPDRLADAPLSGPEKRSTEAKQFDVVLQTYFDYPPCRKGSTCRRLGQARFYKKGEKAPFAVLYAPLVIVKHYNDDPEEYGVASAGDFNFDGFEDFALDNGNRKMGGNYPDSDVYLFDSQQNAFVYSEKMSELAQETCRDDLFGVDPARKHLTTGCHVPGSYDDNTTYKVENNIPVAVEKTVGVYGILKKGRWKSQKDIEEEDRDFFNLEDGEQYAWKYTTLRLVKDEWKSVDIKYVVDKHVDNDD